MISSIWGCVSMITTVRFNFYAADRELIHCGLVCAQGAAGGAVCLWPFLHFHLGRILWGARCLAEGPTKDMCICMYVYQSCQPPLKPLKRCKIPLIPLKSKVFSKVFEVFSKVFKGFSKVFSVYLYMFFSYYLQVSWLIFYPPRVTLSCLNIKFPFFICIFVVI